MYRTGSKIFGTFGVLLFFLLTAASSIDRLSVTLPGIANFVPQKLRSSAARSASSVALVQNRPGDALREAARAVRNDPVDPHSVASLATARLNAGDAEGAYEAFRIAAQFGWRNLATQYYWYIQALSAGDWQAAMDRADAILRVSPTTPGANDLLFPFESDAGGRKILVRHLVNRPSWLRDYLKVDPEWDSERISSRNAVLISAAKAGEHFGCNEVSKYVRGLLSLGERRGAEAVWNGHCLEKATDGMLADGDFSQLEDPDDSPFGWTVYRTGDVSLKRATPRGVGGLVMSNSSPTTHLVMSQPLALPPGRYGLRVDFGKRPRPGQVRFAFACDTSLALPGRADGDLSGGYASFTVGVCDRQYLGIWLAAPSNDIELKSLRIAKLK